MPYSFKHILNEAAWEKTYSAYRVIKQYPGKWVHFSDEGKMGINPLSHNYHNDAPGIYLYPTDFIIKGGAGGDVELIELQGVTYKSFYIASLLPTTNMLVLDDLTDEKCKDIAEQNGWLDVYEKMLLKKDEWVLFEKSTAEIFYAILGHLTTRGKHTDDEIVKFATQGRTFTWFTLLKGFDGIIDSNGVIYSGEDEQMVVFSKRNLKIEYFEHNKKIDTRKDDIVEVIDKLGGDIENMKWQNGALLVGFSAMGVNGVISLGKSGLIRAITDSNIHIPIDNISPGDFDFVTRLRDSLEDSLYNYKRMGY